MRRSLEHQIIWALMQETLSSGVREQQKGQLVCAFMQIDQRLCYLPIGKYHI